MEKSELREYRSILRESEDLELEILRWRTKAQKCTKAPEHAPAYGGSHDPYPVIMDKIIELEAVLRTRHNALVTTRRRIETAINALESRERRLIRLRYIEGWGWERIADEMGYGRKQVYRIHGWALEKMSHNVP